MVLSHSLCVKATKYRNAHRLEKRELTSFRVNVSCMRYIFSPWPPKPRVVGSIPASRATFCVFTGRCDYTQLWHTLDFISHDPATILCMDPNVVKARIRQVGNGGGEFALRIESLHFTQSLLIRTIDQAD